MIRKAKICGLTDEDAVVAAVKYGAAFLGAVFFPPSPRHLSPERAAELFDGTPEEIVKVGLFVDPTDDDLDQVLALVRLDMIQLHGSESPERVDAVRAEFGLPVMKALSIRDRNDLDQAARYADHADWLLFDAKAPEAAACPGGNAQSFDWSVLEGFHSPLPWMLAGGLTPDNVAEALRRTNAAVVDVSSGVERAPGQKDPAKIKAFLKAVNEG